MAGDPIWKQGPKPKAPPRRLRQQSAKRQAERDARREVQRDALMLSAGRCAAERLVPEVKCWHPAGLPLDTDERKSRGVNPGGHLDPTNVQALCRAHHTWRTEHPAEAHARGLRVKSWE